MDKLAGSIKRVVTNASAGYAKKVITLESSNLAKFSDGACTCRLGDTNVLVTAVSQPGTQPSSSGFLPLTVDYKQKAAAAGRIPMTHMRRDIGFSEKEILTSRMIDRSIRPAFVKGFNDQTQIVCNLLSVDGHNDPDILAINGASASLAVSSIPWNGPIGAVRMGLIGEVLIPNPTRKELDESRLNLVITANKFGNIMMLDGSCREPILITDIVKAIRVGIKECNEIVEAINRLQKLSGKPKRPVDMSFLPTQEQRDFVQRHAETSVEQIFTNYKLDKTARDDLFKELRENTFQQFKDAFPDANMSQFQDAFTLLVKITYRALLKKLGIRCDGRKFDELRPISCQVDLYKPLHGSAIFQRGQTQVFCSTTFDSPDTAYRTDPITLLMSGAKEKNFMLHYEFPPFATNEVGRVGSLPGRREIGHGALAEKAIRPMIPGNDDITIRLNCEVLESNGSSSMASVCAGSLSLMDASVDIKEHVAGVSIGLMSDPIESNDKSSDDMILTDILGFEDYIGDMDFKIAGTRKAITALQLDVKPTQGISPKILYKAISKAHSAKERIIVIMNEVLRKPRTKKENHPVLKTIYIPSHKKSKFIGLGGSNLKKLTAHIGVRITMLDEQLGSKPNDDGARGNVLLFAPNQEAMQEAEEFISQLLEKETCEPELDFNGVYSATIEEIRPNGVMVTLYANMTPTLLHLSQLDIRPVSHPSALNLSVGQQIQVKYFGRDPATGQMRLSRKSLQMSSTSKIHNRPIQS